MKFASWKDIIEVIGITAIVASLLFVGLQMQQEQEIAITETRSAVTQTISDLAAIIEAAPGTWKRGLDGAELSEEERITFNAMTEAVESHFFHMFLRFGRLGVNDPEPIARDYAYALYVYPGLRHAYLEEGEYRELTSAAFGESIIFNPYRDLVLSYLKALEDNSAPVPANKRYVFW